LWTSTTPGTVAASFPALFFAGDFAQYDAPRTSI
jgi:hypothetical protein